MSTKCLHFHKVICQFRSLFHHTIRIAARNASSAAGTDVNEFVAKRNFLFSEEKRRQYEDIGRVDKISVTVKGPSEEVKLVMNKHISTPMDCAQHISEAVVRQSVLAMVNSSVLWDLHCPLTADCQLSFLHFKIEDPYFVNKAFWRTCSLVLGAVISNSFKNNIPVTLHSFPSPNVRSGSFVYDVALGLNNWESSKDELRILSGEMIKFAAQDHKVERLAVSKELALEMFEGNHYKQQQIPDIAAKNEESEVVLYRVSDHIDISRGPMIGNTSHIGRTTITAVHKIDTDAGQFYRFQGIALPKGIMLNHYAYGILEDRAKHLNQGRFPGSSANFNEDMAVSAH